MMRSFVTTGAIAALIVGAGLATANAEPMKTMSMSTPEFVKMASQSDAFEIKEGKLAEKVGTPAVQKFGERMVRDHTKTTEELHAALKEAGMKVPPPPALTAEQDDMDGKLQGLKGKAFDHAYIEQAVASHKKALALHESYDEHGESKPIVAASEKATKIVKEHLHMAESLAAGKSGDM